MRFSIPTLLLMSLTASAQISQTQQKALNSYVDYANQSADEVTSVVTSIISYFPSIHQKSSWGAPRYTCPVQLEDYYLNNALALSKGLSATVSTPLNAKLKELRGAAEKIDEKCKALDTYHKLEDYKQDNFAKAELMINELQVLISDYRKKQKSLQAELETWHKKLSGTAENTYHKADAMMRAEVAREKDFIDSWTFNLREEIPTGWPVDKLEKSILATDTQLKALQQYKPALKYPASSMWPSFQSNLASVLSTKRSALDGYNFEARKSDQFSNEVYMGLINYVNGTLVADYNAFLDFSQRDGYYGLKVMKYFPSYEIRMQPKVEEVEVKPFKDIPRSPVTVTAQKTAVPRNVFDALSNYVDFINETWRQTRYMQAVYGNLNSSAAYYKTLDSFERRGAMYFDYKDFKLPLSQYQKTVGDSKVLPPLVAKSLNDQSEVLLNILKEMNALSAALETETKEKRYEKDRLTKVYEIIERQKVLFDLWDEKKELLYQDVRKVNDAYVPANATSSWYKSGKALQKLTDLDHDALFEAKSHYSGKPVASISTDKIDDELRNVIGKEYDNMKGIEKLGRYNGLCPYTPYEDLPATSKSMSEEIKKLKPVSEGRYEHPYYRMVYYYNDIVDDYNKFCELSKDISHLQTIKQPELFNVKYPEAKIDKPQEQVKPVLNTPVTSPAEAKQTTDVRTSQENPVPNQQHPVQATHDTKLLHDTVYIERRDTVYIAEPGENLRSMEGYAVNNMVLLLDVSGSMNAPEKLPLLKNSVLGLLSMMRPEDEVTIVAFSGKPKVLLEATSFQEEDKIKKAINNLTSSGKTDGNAGLKLAYKVADENYIRGGNNRIILATDGEFALSDEARELIAKFSKDDIFLTVFNFGKGAGSSKALESLAMLGKGNYEYISKENVELKLIREAKAKKQK